MLALLFPGQGSQEAGMGRDLWDASPAARSVFETADEALGFSLARLCFEGPEEELRRTELQQPAILTTSIAVLRALEERCGPLPAAYLLGHSLGEYTALVAAGALTLSDAVALVHARGRFMQEAVGPGRGAMAAVLGCGPEEVAAACRAVREVTGRVVAPANFNGPTQTVIAGEAGAVQRASEELRARGARRITPLPVSAPFHCELMAPAGDKLAAELARVRFSDPSLPVVTNVEAQPNVDATRIPDLLRRQVTAPVRFTESVEQLVALGVKRVLELGPGRVLTALVARIDRSLERASACSRQDVDELAGGWFAASV